jgi:hypothetical protein
MGWMDVYQHYFDDEEPDPPVQIRNCPHCGRFLTKEPNGTYQGGERNGHFEYRAVGDDDYEQIWVDDGPPILHPPEPVWICKCGSQWDSSEMFS